MSSPYVFSTSQERRHADLLRSERTMVWVRAFGVAFGGVQVLTYGALPYPPGYFGAALAVLAALVVVDVLAAGLLIAKWPSTPTRAQALAVSTVSLDTLVSCGFVFVYSFDPTSAHWAILFVVPLLGAARFRLGGAMATWAAVTALYTARQAFAAANFDDIGFSPSSIGFRMGLVLMVALVAGLLARDLAHERERTAQALQDVARTDQLRARLVGSLAHDIRSPLIAVSGALKALNPSQPPATQTQLLDLARRQTDRLSRLATGMLDLAQLERGQLVLQRDTVNLAEIVDAAVESLGPTDGEVRVDVDANLSVHADRDRLDQIVYNLVGNAMRHGRPPVEVTAQRTREGVLLAVRDHGPGVPEGSQDGLFDAFVTSATGGVGLGLWLVRALADAHDGRVSYQSVPEGGARFEVLLPESAH